MANRLPSIYFNTNTNLRDRIMTIWAIYSFSKTASILVTVTHKKSSIDNASDVSLELTLPSYVIYEQFTSNGSCAPDDVTDARNKQMKLSITMKVACISLHLILIRLLPYTKVHSGQTHDAYAVPAIILQRKV